MTATVSFREIKQKVKSNGKAAVRRFFVTLKSRPCLDSGIKEFKSDVNTQEVQKLLYLYVIAKEQRNFSNHANVDESKKALAFDVGEIRRLLETIIETILAL